MKSLFSRARKVTCICAGAISKAFPKIVMSVLSDESYQDRWIESTFKGSDAGKFKWTAGKFYNDADLDKGRLKAF